MHSWFSVRIKKKIKREEGRTIGAVKEIEQLLGMKDLNRMEAYDISNINGFENRRFHDCI